MRARQLQRAARHFGRNERIAIAVAADPRAETQNDWQIEWIDFQIVSSAKRRRNLAVELWKSFEDRDVVVVKTHLHFIEHCGPARTDFVRLPQRGDFGQDELFEPRHILRGNGNAIERLKKLADAPALEHDRAARRFSGVRSE